MLPLLANNHYSIAVYSGQTSRIILRGGMLSGAEADRPLLCILCNVRGLL
jgi:hypothetical protein